VDTPYVFDNASVYLGNYYGLYIEDLERPAQNTEAILVEAQGGGCGADDCNVRIAGVGHDSGHLVVGNQHIWDGSGGLRVKAGIPTGDGDGGRILTTHTTQMTIINPDHTVPPPRALPLLAVEPDWAPNGITLLACGIKTDRNTGHYTVDFEEWASPADLVPSLVEQITSHNSFEARDDGTLSDPEIAAGSILYVDLPANDVDYTQVWCAYSVD
jgi:hypothetical protein